MKEIILIKNGELALKGLNRRNFEDALIKNIKRRLKSLGETEVRSSQSTIYIEPKSENYDFEEALCRVKKIFGIAGFSRACVCEKTAEDIFTRAPEYLKPIMESIRTFKVEAKRSDKKFPLKSPEICRELGGHILSNYHDLKVDVHNPELTVTVEIRDTYAFIRGNNIKGAGGMPVSTSGRGAVLISGGIDSPVAAYMMAKRGIELISVHFASPPYTTELAEQKVMDLLHKVAQYSGPIATYVVPFTELQKAIRDKCPEVYFTIIMRRYMMKIAEIIAKHQNCSALITGESVGQVASQTIYALGCTDVATELPVFRPCIGMDKDEIVRISREIDTFQTSILPYEDCCTVFTPKHPKTRPHIEEILEAEKALDSENLINRAVQGARKTVIK